jgi:HEAT repeat protein
MSTKWLQKRVALKKKNHNMRYIICAFFILSGLAHGAVNPKPVAVLQKKKIVTLDLTTMALRLPYENRIEALKEQGAPALDNLKKIAANTKEPLNNRWKALIAFGELSGSKAEPVVKNYFKSKDWYMRAAALHAMRFGDRAVALKWCSQMLSDPALMVRTSAVQVIDKMGGRELTSLLWEKLYSSENYHRGKSLWIRRNILEILAKNTQAADTNRYLRILNQEDESLHPIVVKALTSITGIARDVRKYPTLDDQKQAWADWASNRQTL